MNTPNTSSTRSAICAALIALGFAFGLACIPVQTLKAADNATLQPMVDKAPSLPVTTSFEKVAGGDTGPYVLKITNTSKGTLKVSAKVLLAVAFHADSKARNIPEHAIDAGQVWTIPGLVVADKIIITAVGFAPLEVAVPKM